MLQLAAGADDTVSAESRKRGEVTTIAAQADTTISTVTCTVDLSGRCARGAACDDPAAPVRGAVSARAGGSLVTGFRHRPSPSAARSVDRPIAGPLADERACETALREMKMQGYGDGPADMWLLELAAGC